jgi:circadian clock protein KaiC
MTKKTTDIARIATGVRNLDDLFFGGLPAGSVTVIGGAPGAGKTILTQQICFHNASAECRVLYFSTLSEPTAKTLRYLSQFSFFDAQKLDGGGIQFIDLGAILRNQGLDQASSLIMERVKVTKPTIVVIDSFKAFDDLAKSKEELRKFGYELAVNLMAWETTTFLLGEYAPHDFQTNPLFSIIDALVMLSQREQSGEQQRFIQIIKMRGSEHSRDEHSFVITKKGAEVFAPRVTIRREDREPSPDRLKTGISKFDALLGDGIPRGSSLLIAGVAGTGKTILLLEFIYRGALAGEKGIVFTFEETEERLRASARGLGWELDRQIELDMVQIVFIAQPEIMVEKHLLMMRERVEAFGARRVAVDSVSVFLHKVTDPQISREKTFQLASVVQNVQAVGFFATDIPYGSSQISRFGVEETVVDGVVLLSATERGLERQRYVEVYKLRNTAHLKGRHNLTIGPGGLAIFPRYSTNGERAEPPASVDTTHRLGSGVTGLDELLGGGLLERSVTLVSGSAGAGKSTLGLQFIAEGARQREAGLFVSLEEGPAQIRNTATAIGLPLARAMDEGLVQVIYLSREHVQASQFLAILEDEIRAKQVRRLVLDGASQMAIEGLIPEELRQLLYTLVTRFKALGVTSMFTLESKSMHSTDMITDHGFSAISDNIILLRYVQSSGEFRPSLAVVKTRGSAHSFETAFYSIGTGGLRLETHIGSAVAKPIAQQPIAQQPITPQPAAIQRANAVVAKQKPTAKRPRGRR